MSKLQFTEMEYKYSAEKISLKDFRNLMIKVKEEYKHLPQHIIEVSGWDIYYRNNDLFYRFRDSPLKPELTTKIKTVDANNEHRKEMNVPLSAQEFNKMSQDHKENLIRHFFVPSGCKENFRIYKTCFIYFIGNINYVYYITYDENMKESGRYIEIEFSEEEIQHFTEPEAVNILNAFEKALSPLGITKESRLKQSLFEIFRAG